MDQQAQQRLNEKGQGSGLGRALKIFLALGCAGTLVIGGLLIWAALTAVQHVASLDSSGQFKEQVAKVKEEIAKLPSTTKVGCWDKVVSMLDARVWLEKAPAENISTIREACWPGNQPGSQPGVQPSKPTSEPTNAGEQPTN